MALSPAAPGFVDVPAPHGIGERVSDRAVDVVPGSGRQSLARHLRVERSISRTLDLAFERSRALDRVCAQGVAGRLGIAPTEGLAEALLDGTLDDFTSADLMHTSLADADLTGVRWSLSGTIWPPGTDVKTLLARSEEIEPGGGVLVVTRRGMVSPFAGQAPVL